MVVAEVKIRYDKDGIQKDLTTLKCMLNCYMYQLGVLIYTFVNDNQDKLKKILLDEVNENEKLKLLTDKIFLFYYSECGAEFLSLKEFLASSPLEAQSAVAATV